MPNKKWKFTFNGSNCVANQYALKYISFGCQLPNRNEEISQQLTGQNKFIPNKCKSNWWSAATISIAIARGKCSLKMMVIKTINIEFYWVITFGTYFSSFLPMAPYRSSCFNIYTFAGITLMILLGTKGDSNS